MNASAYIQVTKEFRFEMAHELYGHKDKCSNIHGHSYCLAVTVAGPVIGDPGGSSDGMVIDFSDLSQLVREHVIDVFDHALVLNEASPRALLAQKNELSNKVVLVAFQPTCENLLVDIARRLAQRLPKGVKLHSIRLRETPTSYAEWFSQDKLST